MTRFPHDEFAKEYLPKLLTEYGKAESSVKIQSEIREIDVLFTPDKEVPSTPETLGLLGKMAQKTCLFEVFRNPVTPAQVRSCIGKLYDIHADKNRESLRENQQLAEANLPFLWILAPTVSQRILREFRAESNENWLEGIYFLGKGLYTGIVVIHKLPESQETLWLRILGRKKVQEKAISEFKALPLNNPLRENIVELVYGFLTMLQINQKDKETLEGEDKKLLMQFQSLYRERLAKEKQEGIFNMIESILITRFGNIDSSLETIMPELIKLPPAELTPLLLNLSKGELLARFGNIN